MRLPGAWATAWNWGACARILIKAGIYRVVHRGDFDDSLALQCMQDAGIELVEFPARKK